ncbi:ATP-binding protein [Streptomyces atratus]
MDTTVPDELAEHVVAVAAEAVSNASRHARASRIGIVLSADDGVTPTVTDNGIGIGIGIPDGDTTTPGTPTAVDDGAGAAIDDGDQPARRGGGPANMRTRAELCGGTPAIERPADGGTRITWCVPLHD